MVTDSALMLRLAFEKKEMLSDDEITNLLHESTLIKKLTADFTVKPLSAVFRIMGLSEIPYVERLPYVRNLINYINREIATTEGFSCLGGVSEIVPCYNAMLLEAYCRLGLAKSKEAQAALTWLKRYQLFDRNQTTTWPHKGVCKHGGCLGKIPCYIGIGKSVRALITYAEVTQYKDKEVEDMIEQGLSYMMRHNYYQRLSDGKLISAHITDIMIPQNYALSLTDLVYIIGKRNLTKTKEALPLMTLLREKQVSEQQWKIDYIYRYDGYVAFESRQRASKWISTLFPIWLS